MRSWSSRAEMMLRLSAAALIHVLAAFTVASGEVIFSSPKLERVDLTKSMSAGLAARMTH